MIIAVAVNVRPHVGGYLSCLEGKLKLFIPCVSPVRLESAFHDYFSGKRVRGEWFSLSRQDFDTVELMVANEKFGLGLLVSGRIYERLQARNKVGEE